MHVFYNLSSSKDKIYFKSNSMSLGLILSEEMFMHRWTPQSDAIMSADLSVSLHKQDRVIKIASEMPVPHSLGKYF